MFTGIKVSNTDWSACVLACLLRRHRAVIILYDILKKDTSKKPL